MAIVALTTSPTFARKASHHYSKHEATKYQTAATFPGCYYDGKLPEPRKRTGGTGTPAHEVRAVVPSFEYGLPTVLGWIGWRRPADLGESGSLFKAPWLVVGR
jgi:hypothetical protein